MYLYRLDREQRRAFLEIAQNLAEADEYLRVGELREIELARREAELPQEDVAEATSAAPTVNELAAEFTSPTDRRILLLELLRIGYADEEFAPRENQFLMTIVDQLDIDDEMFATLVDWAVRHREIVAAGEKLAEGKREAFPP